ncbi:unnamed protein product [Effrenium voratum]|uniref:Flavodoxin-like domain-containing protein n=1 Tax=Effrenium voratum TaxID=2562239 RepID=A0AA36N8J9_9DINO|nr:unnamed protein product [Effrenium voratum]CAJ1430054.1 unnamed protein product [Effrenium voratum]
MAAKNGDPRLGSLVKPYPETAVEAGGIALIGFPFDEGCVRNGGRAGAKLGPEYFRKFLKGMGTLKNPEFDIDLSSLHVYDCGNISASSLEEGHQQLEDVVSDALGKSLLPFVVGGGNDQSAPNGRALLRHTPIEKVSVINIDAHLDVRPREEGKVHSGTPFRELLEGGLEGTHFCEFAVQGNQCSADHADFVKEKKGSLLWYSKISDNPLRHFQNWLDEQGTNDIFVSFDIDAIRSADCPGVSCPANYGLSAQDALHISRAAGRHPQVKLFDMSELNPAIEDYRSPRLAVLIFYYFLLGYSERLAKK